MWELVEQAGFAGVFYLGIIGLFRLAGKRLAGQTTTFDLVILISLSVALQKALLQDGKTFAFVFIGTVFCLHQVNTELCNRFPKFRRFLRGGPALLVLRGRILHSHLESERLSVDELMAGLRKSGVDKLDSIKTAYLEETGQITVVEFDS